MSRKNPRQVGNLEEHSGNSFISSIAERSDMSLLWQIERHLKETGTPPTLFGRRAVRDPRLVHHLRRGRQPGQRMDRRVLAFINSHNKEATKCDRYFQASKAHCGDTSTGRSEEH